MEKLYVKFSLKLFFFINLMIEDFSEEANTIRLKLLTIEIIFFTHPCEFGYVVKSFKITIFLITVLNVS